MANILKVGGGSSDYEVFHYSWWTPMGYMINKDGLIWYMTRNQTKQSKTMEVYLYGSTGNDGIHYITIKALKKGKFMYAFVNGRNTSQNPYTIVDLNEGEYVVKERGLSHYSDDHFGMCIYLG